MTKKILLFFPHEVDERRGGPYTYLYHLRQSFQNDDALQLVFLTDLIGVPCREATYSPSFLKSVLKALLPHRVANTVRVLRHLKALREVAYCGELEKLDLSPFAAIHFHGTEDIWRFNDLLAGYKGKIILTSHSPVPFHRELLEESFHLSKEDIPEKVVRRLEEIDTTAFEKCDLIVAPCKEAMDAYYAWPLFERSTAMKPFHFIPTGISSPQPTESGTAIRRQLGIPDEAFVVCFNGRHTAVKGFDIAMQTAKELLLQHDDIYFVITGNKEPSPNLVNRRWIETGWTNVPQNYLAAADLVFVPNRQSYFDLNVLETLALAKPLVVSATGGNLCLEHFQSPGIFFFAVTGGSTAAAQAINAAYGQRRSLAQAGVANKEIFQEHFTREKFAQRYKDFYKAV